jgi:hypothetical protein
MTSAAREEFIVNYFESIFTAPADKLENYDNVIENFLGPMICDHPLVRDSKLLQEEKIVLENDLSLQELDAAVQECK